ncbi:MAG TPA: helix-turn-helix domain-containing protein [Kofleriaceae bacterium]|nr:helix-turn-helix domain-containing protein [Kofleriaceae bacterium]
MPVLLLSPRQLADAIGVSESSLKRWADAGKLAVSRTDGGHRRIAVSEAVRFIRDSGATVVRPDLLGLAGASAAADAGASKRRGQFRASQTGRASTDATFADARVVRTALVARFLGGESIAALGDGPIADAIARIADLRAHGRDAKCEMLARAAEDAWTHAIAAVRALCNVGADAPVAVGGARAPAADAPHVGTTLRSAVVAAVLAGEGLRAIDLGAHVGGAVLRAAVAAHQPAITWLVDDITIDLDNYRVRTLAEVAAFTRGRRR